MDEAGLKRARKAKGVPFICQFCIPQVKGRTLFTAEHTAAQVQRAIEQADPSGTQTELRIQNEQLKQQLVDMTRHFNEREGRIVTLDTDMNVLQQHVTELRNSSKEVIMVEPQRNKRPRSEVDDNDVQEEGVAQLARELHSFMLETHRNFAALTQVAKTTVQTRDNSCTSTTPAERGRSMSRCQRIRNRVRHEPDD